MPLRCGLPNRGPSLHRPKLFGALSAPLENRLRARRSRTDRARGPSARHLQGTCRFARIRSAGKPRTTRQTARPEQRKERRRTPSAGTPLVRSARPWSLRTPSHRPRDRPQSNQKQHRGSRPRDQNESRDRSVRSDQVARDEPHAGVGDRRPGKDDACQHGPPCDPGESHSRASCFAGACQLGRAPISLPRRVPLPVPPAQQRGAAPSWARGLWMMIGVVL